MISYFSGILYYYFDDKSGTNVDLEQFISALLGSKV